MSNSKQPDWHELSIFLHEKDQFIYFIEQDRMPLITKIDVKSLRFRFFGKIQSISNSIIEAGLPPVGVYSAFIYV